MACQLGQEDDMGSVGVLGQGDAGQGQLKRMSGPTAQQASPTWGFLPPSPRLGLIFLLIILNNVKHHVSHVFVWPGPYSVYVSFIFESCCLAQTELLLLMRT